MALFFLVFASGCGWLNSVKSVVGGVHVEEHQTESLKCGVALYAESVSVSCVAKTSCAPE